MVRLDIASCTSGARIHVFARTGATYGASFLYANNKTVIYKHNNES